MKDDVPELDDAPPPSITAPSNTAKPLKLRTSLSSIDGDPHIPEGFTVVEEVESDSDDVQEVCIILSYFTCIQHLAKCSWQSCAPSPNPSQIFGCYHLADFVCGLDRAHSLANLSALSLPSILGCPGTHLSITVFLNANLSRT